MPKGKTPDLANLSDTQLNWLDETLAEAVETNPDRPVFIFIHQPMEGTVAATFEGSDIAQSAELMGDYRKISGGGRLFRPHPPFDDRDPRPAE